MTVSLTPDRQTVLRRRVRLLVAATISYNVVEAVVALAAGTMASSVALIGFGLDSVIEVSSAAAVAWQFAGPDPQRRERTALRLIAWSFFALAAYVTVEAVRALFGAGEAERSARRDGARGVERDRHAVPVPGAAAGRARAGLGQRSRRLQADAVVHLPVGGGPGWAGAQRHAGLVVGRSGRRRSCWPRWRSRRAEPRGAATSAVLRAPARRHPTPDARTGAAGDSCAHRVRRRSSGRLAVDATMTLPAPTAGA